MEHIRGVPLYGEIAARPWAEGDLRVAGVRHTAVYLADTTCALVIPEGEPYFFHLVHHLAGDEYREWALAEIEKTLGSHDGVRAILVGEPADWLFAAVTGRFFGVHPDEATVEAALTAREVLRTMAEVDEGFRVAWEAVTAHGPHIRPWLGTTKLDEHGRPILDDPCYEYEFELPIGETAQAEA